MTYIVLKAPLNSNQPTNPLVQQLSNWLVKKLPRTGPRTTMSLIVDFGAI